MGINKVQYGNTTLIDLTADTVTADKLLQGYTAHDRTGAVITGTATGGGGSVTQDQDGFIVLPSTGGGGGGSSWTKLTTTTFTVSTTSTSNITVGTISAGVSAYTSDKILVVLVKDKVGPRADHFLSSETWFINSYPANGSTSVLSIRGVTVQYVTSTGKYGASATTYGIYANKISSSGSIEIYARYSSSESHIIDGEYQCDVYLLDWPDGTPLIPLT